MGKLWSSTRLNSTWSAFNSEFGNQLVASTLLIVYFIWRDHITTILGLLRRFSASSQSLGFRFVPGGYSNAETGASLHSTRPTSRLPFYFHRQKNTPVRFNDGCYLIFPGLSMLAELFWFLSQLEGQTTSAFWQYLCQSAGWLAQGRSKNGHMVKFLRTHMHIGRLVVFKDKALCKAASA